MSEGMKNPGWAGETGEFDLSESEVRGVDYVGEPPKEGWDNGWRLSSWMGLPHMSPPTLA